MVSNTEPLRHVIAVAAGHNHALALLEDGTVVRWVDNSSAALGELSGSTCGQEAPAGGGRGRR